MIAPPRQSRESFAQNRGANPRANTKQKSRKSQCQDTCFIYTQDFPISQTNSRLFFSRNVLLEIVPRGTISASRLCRMRATSWLHVGIISREEHFTVFDFENLCAGREGFVKRGRGYYALPSVDQFEKSGLAVFVKFA